MKNIKERILIFVNVIFCLAVCVLNYFYQKRNFDYTLKCITSALFATLGIINLIYLIYAKVKSVKFYLFIALGLLFAFGGDVAINKNFVIGAGIFALGHVFFVIGYCYLQKIKALEVLISGVVFLLSACFLCFSPIVQFEPDLLRWVCVLYALIISCMLGKACANFIRQKQAFYLIIAVASILFFFSDLMLLLDWFVGLWSWTNEACMATYYPALIMLACSVLFKKDILFISKEVNK